MTQFPSDRDRSAAAALVTPPAAFPAAAVIRALPASASHLATPDPVVARQPVGTMSLRAWMFAFLAWTLFGIFSANQTMVFYALTDLEVSTRDTYLVTLGAVWMWVLFTPAIVWLARRFRVERDRRMGRLLIHFGFAFLFSVVDPVLDMLLYPLLGGAVDLSGFLPRFFLQLDINLFSYLIIAAATHAVDYYRLYRERRVRAAELANQLTSAQLQVLKMQLQPHFLFNTLNAISELVHEDAEAADRMITRLGDLLRLSLDMSGEQEVPLRQELDFLTAYLEIEQTRFRDRLSIEMDIAPETLDACVPNLLLQPLVENAIKHGTGARAAAGHIAIATHQRNGSLRIEIRDNGRGLPHPAVLREGVGLRNTRARLVQLYGDSHDFTLRNATDGGTVVSIEIPYRPAPQSAREMSSLDSRLS
jgi:signal transduction histidine kinase